MISGEKSITPFNIFSYVHYKEQNRFIEETKTLLSYTQNIYGTNTLKYKYKTHNVQKQSLIQNQDNFL